MHVTVTMTMTVTVPTMKYAMITEATPIALSVNHGGNTDCPQRHCKNAHTMAYSQHVHDSEKEK
jgi:hypothetical protein